MVSDYGVIRLITKIYAFVVEISTAVVCNYKNSECREKQAVSEYTATSDSCQLLPMLVVIRGCRGYGYPWIYPWIYPCVDIRLWQYPWIFMDTYGYFYVTALELATSQNHNKTKLNRLFYRSISTSTELIEYSCCLK